MSEKSFAEQVQESKNQTAEEVFNNVIEDTPAAAEPEPPPTPEPAPEAPKAKIRIGTQEFESTEDAIKYAQDLELAVLQQDAFNAGKEASKPKDEPSAPKVDPVLKKIADKMFENPEEGLAELTEIITKRAHEQINKENEKAATIRKTWESFYSENQDLVESKELVDFVLQKNWAEIGHLPSDKALKILAEKSRSFIGSYKEKQLPSKELPSTPAITTQPGVAATTTAPQKAKSALDFIAQLQKHRKRE